jgi:TldD protein
LKDLIYTILDLGEAKGISYVDVRVVEESLESYEVKDGLVEVAEWKEGYGFGIRILHHGAWGFACSSSVNKTEMEEALTRALSIAEASGMVRENQIELFPIPTVQDHYRTPMERDPFEISPEEKISLLIKAEDLMRGKPYISVSQAFMDIYRVRKVFASSEGSCIEQEIVECGAGIAATAAVGNDVQTRSYPNSFRGNFATGGYEFIEALDVPGNAERTADEAAQLLFAQPCPSKVTTLILDSSQLALQIHESIGHPVELDRVLGMEVAYAGTSFLIPENRGSFRSGSDSVNIIADATIPGGLGTFGYDDEGVKAQRIPILQNGIFLNFLASRETAREVGSQPNGTMRAESWNRIPLIRMTNINLQPGNWGFEDLIADTDDGIYMATNRSWSIDDRRLNFQFGTEIAREIKKGKMGKLLKNPTYTGITPHFWNACDAVAAEKEWRLWGIPNCGKGQPGQVAHVSHGAAPARFRNVRVGVMG